LEIYNQAYPDWFSKPQRTELKKLKDALESHDQRIDTVSARRVVDDFIGLTGAVEITGSAPGKKGPSTLKVVAGKTPWLMAEDRALLPITSRINDFLVTERFVDPDTKTGAVGTSGLIFMDTKQKTARGQDALYNVMNNIFGTS
jgi:hypothetical protein